MVHRSLSDPRTARVSAIHEPPNPDYDLVIRRAAYKARGGSISCGHDRWAWDKLKVAKGGEMILCNRCGQYLVVLLGLPWVCEGRGTDERGQYRGDHHTNHLGDKWLHPIEARVTNDD